MENEGKIATRKDLPPALFRDYNSPVATWREFMAIQPYDWQYAGWSACWNYGAQVAIRTCNEAGKSGYFVPVLASAWAVGFPGGMCVITSSSEDQLGEQLWPVLKLIANKKKWRTYGTTVELPSVDGVLPGSKIICRVTKEGERFEGYHSKLYPDKDDVERFCPLMTIFDEAKSIKQTIFDAGERCNPAVELYISTTGDDSGNFHDACMSEDWVTGYEWQGKYYKFAIPWEQCPHLYEDPITYKRKMALINRLGRDHPFIVSNLYAGFFRSGTYQVFTDADIRAAQDAMSQNRPHIGKSKRAWCDFSGGGDELTFGVRNGNYIHPIVGWNRSGHVAPSDEADAYIRLFKQFELNSQQIYGDNGGMGAGIITEMKKKSYTINRVNSNQNPMDKTQFADKATEDYWAFKQALHDSLLILPKDEKLLKQMRLRRYVMKNTEDNKFRLEPKRQAKEKRKEASPDRLETIVGLVAGMESMPTIEDIARGTVKTGIPAEYFKKVKEGMDNNEDDSVFGEEWD